MSLFGKIFRNSAAATAFAIGAGSLLGQDPVVNPPAILNVPTVSGSQDPVTPASGFGRGTRTAPPCYPTPTTPCPVTGQPMTPGMPDPNPNPQPPVPEPIPEPPALTGLGRGAGAGPVVGLGGYIENAAPTTMARLRFDAGYGSNRPDRGEFFYAKCGCFQTRDAHGPVLMPERNVDYQELTSSVEVAFTQRFSAFFNVPVRFLNPDLNANAAGISDISFGGKYAVIYNEKRVVSFWLQFQAPSGSTTSGLGNGNWWIQPGILYLEQLSKQWQLFGEFRYQTSLGARSDFTGDMIRYGIGTSYAVAQGQWGYVAPVAELVGWTVLSGKELNPDLGNSVNASGDTIVNAKIGVRVGLGVPALGSPYPTRSDLYVGYGRALTGAVWYKDLLRVEYRYFF